jgi:hypothetical protein
MSIDGTPEDMYRKYINADDLTRFKWRILRYMCELCEKYESFPETELFHRTDLKAYIDNKLSQQYLSGKKSLYKIIMTNVKKCLIDRDAVEVSYEYEYGDSKMIIYKKKKKLLDVCSEFERYHMGYQLVR